MHKNRAWLAFLTFMLFSALYFCGIALWDLAIYRQQTHMAKPLSLRFNYQEVGKEMYAPLVEYTFNEAGKIYEREESLRAPLARNEFAAQDMLEELKTKQWQIWYSPQAPNRATLQKHFPLKECLTAIALLGLLFYFLSLGFYVGGKAKKERP